ncbi:MAG: hypothetical protein Q8R13_00275 [bacterium]|nr:hypothetical protein [bacterium]MDZ4296647.1 hypothetical protein [Patescibacteria group bacterium]
MIPNWKRLILSVGIPFVVSAGMIGAVLFPHVSREEEALALARQRFAQDAERVRSIELLRQHLAEVKKEELNRLFISAERPIDFIENLEGVARLASTTIEIQPFAIKAAQTVKGKPAPPPELQGYEVRLKGSFPAALAFLRGLETQPRLFWVQNFSSQAVTERGQRTPQIQTIIRIHAPIAQ